jgi:hypothetical protein
VRFEQIILNRNAAQIRGGTALEDEEDDDEDEDETEPP